MPDDAQQQPRGPDRRAQKPPADYAMVLERIGFIMATLESHDTQITEQKDSMRSLAADIAGVRTAMTEYQTETGKANASIKVLIEALAESISSIADRITTAQAMDQRFAAFLAQQEKLAATVLADREKARKQLRSVVRAFAGLLSVMILGLVTLLAGRLSNKLGENLTPAAIVSLLGMLAIFVIVYWKTAEVGDTHD